MRTGAHLRHWLLLVGIGWTALVLGAAVAAQGGVYCLGGFTPAAQAAAHACNEAARFAEWGLLAVPWGIALMVAVGWGVVAAVGLASRILARRARGHAGRTVLRRRVDRVR